MQTQIIQPEKSLYVPCYHQWVLTKFNCCSKWKCSRCGKIWVGLEDPFPPRMPPVFVGGKQGILVPSGGGGVGVPSGVTYGCPTCVADLRCEDNAADTVVVNDGTGADWVAGANTSTITSTTHTEGSRSFLLDASAIAIYSPANWTSEEFVVTFYLKLVSADNPATSRTLWVVNATGASFLYTNSNNVGLIRSTGGTLLFGGKGNGGTGYQWTSTNWTPDTNWHKYTITVDASTAPWTTLSLQVDTTTITWDASDMPTAAAAFAGPMWFGNTTADRQPNAYYDVITVDDNT